MRCFGFVAALSLLSAGCGAAPGPGGAPQPVPAPVSAFLPESFRPLGNIDIRTDERRPTLALVAREGDPVPALVATFAVNTPQAVTAALSGVVEARLKASGLNIDTRIDRASFRVRMATPDMARVSLFFAVLSDALRRPILVQTPETALAAERVDALKRHALDADALKDAADCAQELGMAAGEPAIDLRSHAGVDALDTHRRNALHRRRMAIGVAGPPAFCSQAAALFTATNEWQDGQPSEANWPSADSVFAYPSAELYNRQAKLVAAVRVADPLSAASAAERLGAPDSPLVERLAALPEPFRVVEVSGVARTHGGCVKVAVQADALGASALEKSAATAAALVRQEMETEIAAARDRTVAARQILRAADPRDAAALASWWALSGAVPGAASRWTTVLGLPANNRTSGAASAGFARELAQVFSMPRTALDRRLLVERGQGETWIMLGGLCGAGEEGSSDAGVTALAALSMIQSRRGAGDVALEPWITADGIGVIAHASFRDERETKNELAARVADAAARALTATSLRSETLPAARASLLGYLEQSVGHHGIAFEEFAQALSPEHPSWLVPLGLWNRVAQSSFDSVRLRWQAFTAEPMRIAVLANVDAEQSQAALLAAERWIAPARGALSIESECKVFSAAPARPGRIDLRLPKEAGLAQALIGAEVPGAGKPGHELAYLTSLALDGPGGLLEAALGASRFAARASAHVMGGARASALVIDVRAPSDSMSDAIDQVKAVLKDLAEHGVSGPAAVRALGLAAERFGQARTEPKQRLIELWTGHSAVPAAAAASIPFQALSREFLARVLRDDGLVIVDARPSP